MAGTNLKLNLFSISYGWILIQVPNHVVVNILNICLKWTTKPILPIRKNFPVIHSCERARIWSDVHTKCCCLCTILHSQSSTCHWDLLVWKWFWNFYTCSFVTVHSGAFWMEMGDEDAINVVVDWSFGRMQYDQSIKLSKWNLSSCSSSVKNKTCFWCKIVGIIGWGWCCFKFKFYLLFNVYLIRLSCLLCHLHSLHPSTTISKGTKSWKWIYKIVRSILRHKTFYCFSI